MINTKFSKVNTLFEPLFSFLSLICPQTDLPVIPLYRTSLWGCWSSHSQEDKPSERTSTPAFPMMSAHVHLPPVTPLGIPQ